MRCKYLFTVCHLFFVSFDCFCCSDFTSGALCHAKKIKIYCLSIFSLMTFGFLSHGWKSLSHSKVIKILFTLFLVLLWFYFWYLNCWSIWIIFWCTVIGVDLFFTPDGQQVIPTPFIEYFTFSHWFRCHLPHFLNSLICLSLSELYSPVSQAVCSYIRTILFWLL